MFLSSRSLEGSFGVFARHEAGEVFWQAFGAR
jgi:hypothetical protein